MYFIACASVSNNVILSLAYQNAESENTMADNQIYVACLAAYNSGKLHGEWITQLKMLKSSGTN